MKQNEASLECQIICTGNESDCVCNAESTVVDSKNDSSKHFCVSDTVLRTISCTGASKQYDGTSLSCKCNEGLYPKPDDAKICLSHCEENGDDTE